MALSTKSLVYSTGADLGGDGGHHAASDALGLGNGESGFRLGSIRYRSANGLLHLGGGEAGLRSGNGGDCVFDYLIDLVPGQARLGLWHVRDRPSDRLLYVCGGESGSRLRRRGGLGHLGAHYLLDLGAG